MTQIIRAGRVLDGTGALPLTDGGIVVEGGRISRIGKFTSLPPTQAADIIDLRAYTVLPGLIDVHGHLGMDASGNEDEQMKDSDFDIVFRAVKYAHRCLASGVTTMRIVGEKHGIDVAYKKAIEADTFAGPRVLISGEPLMPTNGYGAKFSRVADGPEEVRKTVRSNLMVGADWIKLFVTGGGAYEPPILPTQQYYTFEEIRAAVDVAHAFGKGVAVHALGGTGLRDAIEAGVDTIEHGHFLTKEDAVRMAEKGTTLVATQTIHLYPRPDWQMYPALLEYQALVRRVAGQNIRLAREHGVRVTAGTDAMHGLMPVEVEYLVTYGGLTAMEAIVAATKTAAEVCGVEQETGTLEPNKRADIIAVEGDPLEDIRTLQNVRFVMKAGQVIDLSSPC
ncbi:MAG: amidohydrolase family protein [Ardenticatenaceae bacterium]|nr:amidohydrolase family protein [Ardenticatenaceae bacterium]